MGFAGDEIYTLDVSTKSLNLYTSLCSRWPSFTYKACRPTALQLSTVNIAAAFHNNPCQCALNVPGISTGRHQNEWAFLSCVSSDHCPVSISHFGSKWGSRATWKHWKYFQTLGTYHFVRGSGPGQVEKSRESISEASDCTARSMHSVLLLNTIELFEIFKVSVTVYTLPWDQLV